jgi:glycosyltransferase involved in cell wall biosynthesis
MISRRELEPPVPVRLSVIICSLNGAPGVDRCIRALERQTIASSLELIVVDDGSTDATAAVGEAHGATVIRHAANLGASAARNSGIGAATAPVVAFLDDDCVPEPEWAEKLLDSYSDGITGVGGPVIAAAPRGFMRGYIRRHNPLKPLELDLARSSNVIYRLWLYLGRQWSLAEKTSRRDVYAFPGANMSFLRQALADVNGLDGRFRFGAEELDLCMRMTRAAPAGRRVFVPEARVVHHFVPSVRDTLRRSRAYARGVAQLYRKWPSVPLMIFPGPIAVLAMLLLSVRFPALLVAACVVPQLLYPRGLRGAVAERSGAWLADAYLQLAQEAASNLGFLEGLWRFRHLVPEAAEVPRPVAPGAAAEAPRPATPREAARLVP